MLYLVKSYLKGNKFIYKIGFSENSNIENRLSNYFYMSPGSEIISLRQGDKVLENLLHYYLYYLGYRYQKNGKLNEWFLGDSEVLKIFHIPRESLERKLWKYRDKVFDINKVKSKTSLDYKLFKYLYSKNKDTFIGERYKVTKDKKLIPLNSKEVDIIFYNTLIKYFHKNTVDSTKSNNCEDDKIVNDFLTNYFYSTNIFEEKMKLYCEFMDKYGNNKYILNIIIHKIEPKFKTYYDLFGTSGCRSVGYEESSLKSKIANNLKSTNIKDRLISYFKIKSKYTLKDIKYILSLIYKDLGITKTAKASDLCNYFEVSEIKIYDSVLKKQNKGYLILGIK